MHAQAALTACAPLAPAPPSVSGSLAVRMISLEADLYLGNATELTSGADGGLHLQGGTLQVGTRHGRHVHQMHQLRD